MRPAETARAYLEAGPLLHMNLLEVLRRGSGELLYAGTDGVLLLDRGSGAHMLSAAGPEALERMLPLLEGCTLFVGHQLWYKETIAARFGFQEEQICYQSAWTRPQPPLAPVFPGELRLLDRSWAQFVYDRYSHAFGGVEYIRDALGRGMLGAFVDGEPAGFVGFHDEGSIGMLEVFPAYRRRGLGEALLQGAVRLALARGQYAFGQVFTDNAASIALQRKAGMTLSDERLFWLF